MTGENESRRPQVSLLDTDPDLAGALDPSEFAAAHARAMAHVVAVPGPDWDTSKITPDGKDGWLGLFVIEGLLIRRVTVGRRAACELFGPGDVFRPWDADGDYEPLPVRLEWHVLRPIRLAVLDARFVLRIGPWPCIMGRLVGRVARRARYLAITMAITRLPRVHSRLLILFWLLAERWGTVTREGVQIPLPLTHRVLAMLVGANRPPVTLALQRLSRAGLLIREEQHRWLLTHQAIERLGQPESLALIGAPDQL